jgi:CheY-like chemotaxis protein
VLLDIGLPKLDGYEVAQRLRANGICEKPSVAVTGWARDEDNERAKQRVDRI